MDATEKQPRRLTWTEYIDQRGELRVMDELPFEPVRVFTIENVPRDAVRGEHAHLECEQIITCTSGAFALKTEVYNAMPETWPMTVGTSVYVPTETWITLYDFNERARCEVLCSQSYNPEEVIGDKDAWKSRSST